MTMCCAVCLQRAFHSRQLIARKKRCNHYELHLEADFFDSSLRSIIVKRATVVFVNNHAFAEEMDERIKEELIRKMPDGTRIVSTRPFAWRQRRVNARNVNGKKMGRLGRLEEQKFACLG